MRREKRGRRWLVARPEADMTAGGEELPLLSSLGEPPNAKTETHGTAEMMKLKYCNFLKLKIRKVGGWKSLLRRRGLLLAVAGAPESPGTS